MLEVNLGGGKAFCGIEMIYLVVLLIQPKVRDGIWQEERRWYDFVVNQILDLMLEFMAVVGVVTKALVVGTIEVGAIVWIGIFWRLSWIKGGEDSCLDKPFEHDGSWDV